MVAALALSTIVGVPLGIVASRTRRLGQALMSATGVVQTIPSLALLVFFIPIFGTGVVPALAALFLYGLLPIARNTLAGLEGITPSLLESAEALGLSRWAILTRVKLPLASRMILAGIKTSAVLAVGTATLAAFIGAGGFGAPISVGLNLDDNAVILEGAIPAAGLALLVEGLFAVLERFIVPRGLRLPSDAPTGWRAHVPRSKTRARRRSRARITFFKAPHGCRWRSRSPRARSTALPGRRARRSRRRPRGGARPRSPR